MKTISVAELFALGHAAMPLTVNEKGLESFHGPRFGAVERPDGKFDLFDSAYEPAVLVETVTTRKEALRRITEKVLVQNRKASTLYSDLGKARELERKGAEDMQQRVSKGCRREASVRLVKVRELIADIEHEFSVRQDKES